MEIEYFETKSTLCIDEVASESNFSVRESFSFNTRTENLYQRWTGDQPLKNNKYEKDCVLFHRFLFLFDFYEKMALTIHPAPANLLAKNFITL
jgi:hypothetical protein